MLAIGQLAQIHEQDLLDEAARDRLAGIVERAQAEGTAYRTDGLSRRAETKHRRVAMALTAGCFRRCEPRRASVGGT